MSGLGTQHPYLNHGTAAVGAVFGSRKSHSVIERSARFGGQSTICGTGSHAYPTVRRGPSGLAGSSEAELINREGLDAQRTLFDLIIGPGMEEGARISSRRGLARGRPGRSAVYREKRAGEDGEKGKTLPYRYFQFLRHGILGTLYPHLDAGAATCGA